MGYQDKATYLYDEHGNPFGLKLTRGALDVSVQDPITPALNVRLNKSTHTTTLTAPVSIVGDAVDNGISVTDATGAVPGKFISLANIEENRYFTGTIVSVNVNDLELDCHAGFAFPVSGTVVTFGDTNLAVDGSTTTQIFSLRASDPGLPVSIDLYRIVFICLTDSPVSLDKFGDIDDGLTYGMCLRKRHADGTYNHIANFKTNADIAGTMFDWDPYEAINPIQGIDGFSARFTFRKLGVAIRLETGEDLELLIQDAQETITSLIARVQGHVVSGD